MKKFFNKIPLDIMRQVQKCDGKPFVIYTIAKVKIGDSLPNLPNLKFDQNPITDFETLPDPRMGTWARRNVEGWEIVLKKEPKYSKAFTHESPNFGDWSLGSHEVTVERDVYPRDFFPSYGSPIRVSELERTDEYITVGLELDRVFSEIPEDPRELLFALNVFQEAAGNASVRPTDTPIESYTGSLKIDWEILPIGEREEVLRQINMRLSSNPQDARLIEERMDFLLSLRPRNLVTGSSGFARYVGAQYGDELVAFENIRYGNAIYIMFENWARLSKMTRLQLLNSDEKFERIVHTANWERRVASIIREYRR